MPGVNELIDRAALLCPLGIEQEGAGWRDIMAAAMYHVLSMLHMLSMHPLKAIQCGLCIMPSARLKLKSSSDFPKVTQLVIDRDGFGSLFCLSPKSLF